MQLHCQKQEPNNVFVDLFLFPIDEPLFVKLSSSPAHRRTIALAILSAQSSLEDSSSVTSRSRSVSPLRSRHHDDALLIGLSTGLFDANNPKVSIAIGTPLYLCVGLSVWHFVTQSYLFSFSHMLVQAAKQ